MGACHLLGWSPNQLQALSNGRSSLVGSWESRKVEFEQCMEFQVFMRDTEQTNNWVTKQEVN